MKWVNQVNLKTQINLFFTRFSLIIFLKINHSPNLGFFFLYRPTIPRSLFSHFIFLSILLSKGNIKKFIMEVQVLWTNLQLRTDDEVMGMSEEWLVEITTMLRHKSFRTFFICINPIKKQSKKRNIKNIKKHGEYLPNKL